jgi:dihydrofolate reductase
MACNGKRGHTILAMGLLTFATNVTLDGCVDHREGIADDETHDFFTHVVSSTRTDFPWTNSHHIGGDLRAGVQRLKDATPTGVLLGSGKLATELDRLELIDEYTFLVHPRLAGHGPTLYQSGLPATRQLELVSARPLRNGAVAMHYRRAR